MIDVVDLHPSLKNYMSSPVNFPKLLYWKVYFVLVIITEYYSQSTHA